MTEQIQESISFQVNIAQTADNNWQGSVDIDGNPYPFQSELQMLGLIMEHFPSLQPDVC